MMSTLFIFRLKKAGQILFFILIGSVVFSSTGCGLWKKPWKNSWPNAHSPRKYGKELPDAPLYPGYSGNELVDQAAVLRQTAPSMIQDTDFVQDEKVPWYKKRPLLMSSKAAEIDNHLGK